MDHNPRPAVLFSVASPTMENPWDKEFAPKDFPTMHKIHSTLPKRWELHEDSPFMLKPLTSTAVDQVPDSEIAKCSSWLEAFAARSAHSASISSTSLEAVYTFLQKVIMFLHSSTTQDSIKNNATCLDHLLQRTNFTVWEAQLMSHDAGVTATELFTYLHMLRRRTILESPSVDLPQRDKDRLLVMSLGGNDLFGSNACEVQEWKKDTEEEKVKLISHVFKERESREKAARKRTSSVRPPRSLSHQSPLDAIHPPRTKDSYQRPLGQSFRRDSNKQSSFRPRLSSSSKGKSYVKDKKPVSHQSRSNGGNQPTGQGSARKYKDKGSQQYRSFHKKGGWKRR